MAIVPQIARSEFFRRLEMLKYVDVLIAKNFLSLQGSERNIISIKTTYNVDPIQHTDT